MLKKVPDLVHHYLNSQDRIKYISTAYYYRLFDMVSELVKQSGTNKEDITIITCNFENYRKLKKYWKLFLLSRSGNLIVNYF